MGTVLYPQSHRMQQISAPNMIIRWVRSQHFALPKCHFIHRTKQELLSYQTNTVFRFCNTNRCILNSLWTGLQYSSIPQHYSLYLSFITALMQKVECLRNKSWPNALAVTNGAKLLKFGVFSKSHSSVHILWSKEDSMMWCWYWSLCSLEFGFYCVWTQPATFCSTYKKHVSQETRRTTFRVGVALRPPDCDATFPEHVPVSPTTHFFKRTHCTFEVVYPSTTNLFLTFSRLMSHIYVVPHR
jgi:hypothetical protein